MWSSLQTNGENEEWIFHGLMRGSLIIGHDGSYMPYLANNVCSCAVVLHCTHTGYYADLTWVKRSSKANGNNYRAEILGGVGAQLLVKAAVTGWHMAGSHVPHYGCDSMGVVIRRNHCRPPMLEKQAQADILRLFKSLMLTSCIGGKMNHVHGHMDNLLSQDQLSIDQIVNCCADKLALEALVAGVATQSFITNTYPFEITRLTVKGVTVTGLPKTAITHYLGARVAQTLFHCWNIVPKVDFHLVYWEGMDKVMKSFPEMFQVWATKQVLHFNGTNRQLA